MARLVDSETQIRLTINVNKAIIYFNFKRNQPIAMEVINTSTVGELKLFKPSESHRRVVSATKALQKAATAATSSCPSSSSAPVASKKRVHFFEHVQAILIPTCEEYRQHGICSQLWWTKPEFQQFQQEARSEITLYSNFESISLHESRTRLYQPSLSDQDGKGNELFFLDSCANYRISHEQTMTTNNNDINNTSDTVKFYEKSPSRSSSSNHHDKHFLFTADDVDGLGSGTGLGHPNNTTNTTTVNDEEYDSLKLCIISRELLPLQYGDRIHPSHTSASSPMVTVHSAIAITIVFLVSRLWFLTFQ